jgi:hypothetical protein
VAAAPPVVTSPAPKQDDFVIPRSEPRRQEVVQELEEQIGELIRGSRILQVSKRRDRVLEGQHIDKEGSFLKPYLTDYAVYDDDGKPLREPRAPKDIPLLEEDFIAAGHKGQDHDARWWGVRHTRFDDER